MFQYIYINSYTFLIFVLHRYLRSLKALVVCVKAVNIQQTIPESRAANGNSTNKISTLILLDKRK